MARWFRSFRALSGVDGLAIHPGALHTIRSLASITLLFASACAQASVGPPSDQVPGIVLKLAPAGWAVAEDTSGQVPQGHYWGDQGREYRGPRGRRVVFMGPGEVEFTWRDQNGALQHEKLGKETLELWIMPGDYKESWASKLNFHAPEPAELIFAGANVRVYAKPAARVTSEARFKAILKEAIETRGLDSQPLSWSTWRADLQRELASTQGSVAR
jgi:hypothetical protein